MRLVVKVGTRSLLNAENTLDTAMVGNLVRQIGALKKQGHEIVLVSSGAVGAGRALWRQTVSKKPARDSVLEKQILASLGQASLIQCYNKALAEDGMMAAQLLLTRHDFRHRQHSVNVGRLLEKLITQPQTLPVVNENDSLAVDELMFTDNDELAGLVAAQIGAAKLVILTDVAGVFGPDGGVIEAIENRQALMAVDTSGKGGGRGGMASKLKTAQKMARIGVGTHIAHGRETDILLRLAAGEKAGTYIRPQRKSSPIKRWLAAGVQHTRGQVSVNDRLAEKLLAGETISILPVGLTGIPVTFMKDDVVEILDGADKKIGHGVARYDAGTLSGYLGRRNKPVFIHYDALHVIDA